MPELSTTPLLLVVIVFFAAFQQTLSGFGFSLVVMPLATFLLGIKVAAPLIALAGLTLYTINLYRYHRSINRAEVMRLGAAAVLGVPLGIWGLANLDEYLVKAVLGAILIGFALASLLRLTVTRVLSPHWVFIAGFVTGCLGAAYNTPGPPLIIYGSLRRWERDEFRAVLQALFFLTATLAVLSHILTQRVTLDVLTLYAYAAPALVLGILAGARFDRYINHELFRLIILAMILVLGVSLILGGR